MERETSLGDHVLDFDGDLFHSGSLQRVECVVGMLVGPNLNNASEKIIEGGYGYVRGATTSPASSGEDRW